MAQSRQSRPDYGLDFQAKALKPFQVVPFLLDSGYRTTSHNKNNFPLGPYGSGGFRTVTAVRIDHFCVPLLNLSPALRVGVSGSGFGVWGFGFGFEV